MERKAFETPAPAINDLGEFEALAAAYTIDRARERIRPGAFSSTIKRWRASGKRVPLHWDHRGEAANIIGAIDPWSMQETGEGLFVRGRLDLKDSATAREVWRLMKQNAVGLSFGYLVAHDGKSADGVRELTDLDLFEVSVTPRPANPDTRVLSTKALNDVPPELIGTAWDPVVADGSPAASAPPSIAELRARAARIAGFEC